MARAAVLVLALALLAAGCGGGSNREQAYPTTVTAPATTEATAADNGDFVLQLDDPPTEVQQILDQSGQMADTVSVMNDLIKLPTDVGVAFTAETEEGPAYFPDEQTIVMPDTFADYVVSTLSGAFPDATQDDLTSAYVDIQQFVLLHEMGHALVHLLDLPVLGKEEDAVDALAAVLMTQAGEVGAQIALETAQLFEASGDSEDFDKSAFWDEHSLDLQRAYSIVCWVYGSDPEAYSDLEQVIPEDRIGTCSDEYDQKVKSWLQVLEPYLKL